MSPNLGVSATFKLAASAGNEYDEQVPGDNSGWCSSTG
eukprot:CAMPEP_0176309890 /NCGR_PEP_ID=MMETSP0121_2-20121125/65313_1 /TAXON_ID=160619 /ORGANISM="Kryptoperidinium foliaceum, Strain CCMP 1326" /LENGTH=37 /DNA_ID= /DNA_START= /DNA_END= /DNA_ORIENTATION=